MTAPFAQRFAAIQATGQVTDADVLAMRAEAYADTAISAGQAEAIIAIEAIAHGRPQSWADFYIEALTQYVVRQQTPEGFVDQAKADWLMTHIGQEGRIGRQTGLEVLVHVLETANAAPASLSAFALAQAKASILARGDDIADEDVERIRRIVFAFAGPGNIKVTRGEAEALFDLNDALGGRADAHGWRDVFVKAVANSVMAAQTFTPQTREDELAFEASPQPQPMTASRLGHDIAAWGRDFVHGLPHVLDPAIDPDTLYAERNAADVQARAASEPVDAEEAAWLAARLGRNGTLDGAETALVAYLKQESPQVHAAIAKLNEQAG